MNGVEDLCIGKLNPHRTESIADNGTSISPITGDGLVCFRGITRTVFPELAGKLVRKIAMGPTHTCVIADDELYCWGVNQYGQVGSGTTADVAAPLKITSVPGTLKDVTVGVAHTCAVTTEGVFCVGNNAFGSLGDGSGVFSSTAFVKVAGLPSVPTAIAAGTAHTCAIAGDEVYCWGDNTNDACGNGVNDPTGGPGKVWQRSAVKVNGIKGPPTELALGVWHSCVLTTEGVQCWGDNDQGRLGNGDPYKVYHSADPLFVRKAPVPMENPAPSAGSDPAK
jgi:alpha-tubulin suppressor-like RCC1 family protein